MYKSQMLIFFFFKKKKKKKKERVKRKLALNHKITIFILFYVYFNHVLQATWKFSILILLFTILISHSNNLRVFG